MDLPDFDFRVSVIIPTHNRAETLSRALRSVRRQTFLPEEIIVIDDGSTDKTGSLIRSQFPDIRYYFQEKQGVSTARNRGIAESRFPYVAFLDSDDEWLPQKLELQRTVLWKSNGYKICHTNEIWIRNGKQVNQKKRHRKYGGYIYEKCLPLCCISPSAVIIHKNVFREAGTFDPDLPVCEDYDLWLRLCSRFPVKYIERPLIKKYGGHADQLSRSWGMDRYRILALERIVGNNFLSPKERTETVRMIVQKIQVYLRGARKRKRDAEVRKYEKKLNYYNNYAMTPL